jgi:hypothetical protein
VTHSTVLLGAYDKLRKNAADECQTLESLDVTLIDPSSRPDCKQVVVGLVLDGDGFPKAHEIFAGNRSDSTTVTEMLAVLQRRVGKTNDATVVVDRGMAQPEKLAAIKAAGYHWLVAAPQPERVCYFDQYEPLSFIKK